MVLFNNIKDWNAVITFLQISEMPMHHLHIIDEPNLWKGENLNIKPDRLMSAHALRDLRKE